MSRKDIRNLALAILIFLFVNFSIPFAIAYKWTQAARTSATWPTTIGSMRSSHYTGDRRDVTITYEYGVNGRDYQGSRIRFGIVGDVRELLNSLTNSSELKVSYHPTDPSISVLLPEVSTATKSMKVIGSGGMILSAVAAFAIWRHFRERP
jgi:hypothetical protein